MGYFKYLFFIIVLLSTCWSHFASGSSLSEPTQNSSRQAKGLLETIQSVVQTVQTVNKLFGSSSSSSSSSVNNQNQNNNNNNYYNGGGGGAGAGIGSFNPDFNGNSNNYQQQYQQQPQYQQPQYQQPQYQQEPQIITSQFGGPVPPHFQSQQQSSSPSQIYSPVTQGQVPSHQNYQSFPVSTSLNYNTNTNNNGFYPGVVSNGVVGTGSVKPVNKQGIGSSNLLSSVSELGIIDDLTDLLSFSNVEKVLNNVNKFDSLQCIPRIVCQTIAKRQQEAAEKERMSTTTTTTRRPKSRGRKKNRDGRFIPGFKIKGVDTALEQFVKFLELMQLKDWSVYPYLQGAYQGNQVKSSDECAEKFSTCPFSEDQLLYYFNNYKGGLFQSFRSDVVPSSS